MDDGGRLRLTRVNGGEVALGFGLICLSFFMPALLNVVNFGIYDTLFQALQEGERTVLMLAALKLVAMNCLRTTPHYLGAFLIADGLEVRWGKRVLWQLNTLLVLFILTGVYWSIGLIHDVQYDFGLPALLVMGTVILIYKMNYQFIDLRKKILFLITGCAAFQFLDVMPALAALPVGRGEVSSDVKLASMLIGGNSVLNFVSCAGCAMFLSFTLLFFIQLRVENSLRQLAQLKEQNQAIRTESHINEIKNRTYREMQYLVHDLKSPLTVVQTLVGLIKMKCEINGHQDYQEDLTRVEGAVERMSQMISEILYEEQSTLETVQHLVDRALSQISVEEYAKYVTVHVRAPDAVVRVNRVLFSRALVNLMNNSAKAIPPGRQPDIRLIVDSQEGRVRFQVRDNGSGISKENQQAVWDVGYSGTQSTGLGLSFVRSVVERAGGTIRLESKRNKGTGITLYLPEEEQYDAT